MDIFDAVQNGDIIRVRELLDSGVDPDSKYEFNGKTPLHVASGLGHTDIVELLLEYDANPNIRNNIGDNNGDTSLILASDEGHTEIVKLLLERDADPNIKGKRGNTSLIYASREGHIDIVRLFH